MKKLILGSSLLAILFTVGGYWYFSTTTSVMNEVVSSQTTGAPEELDTETKLVTVPDAVANSETEEVVASAEETHTITAVRTVDTAQLPMGDGKLSTSPKKGYVYSCQTQFSAQKAGAAHTGDWVEGDTWNLNKKIAVQGSVSWPTAWFKSAVSGVQRLLTGNGLPVGSNTGTFPVAKDDPAYLIDRNPNAIVAQLVDYKLPVSPVFAAEPSCVPMGAIGVMLNGVALFNALDAGGRDAVAHEVQDPCNGHPESTGEYHYHGPSDCVEGAEVPNKLIGYALDGFGIYSQFGADGSEYASADLDECHGIVSEIEWNGKLVNMYHYVMTEDYPYTVGCFRGTPVNAKLSPAGARPATQTQVQADAGGAPPAEATAACSEKVVGNSCSIQTPQGGVSGVCQTPPSGTGLVCVPNR